MQVVHALLLEHHGPGTKACNLCLPCRRKREAVRPGSFLTALGATQYSMVEGDDVDANVDPKVLARLELVRQQAIEVLSSMGWGTPV